MGSFGKIWTFFTSKGNCSHTSHIIATSQARSSDGASTTVWKEPLVRRPVGPMKTPGRRITQALGRTGGASRDPAAFAGCFGEISERNAKELRVNSALDVPHKSVKLQIPKLRLPFSNRTVLVDGK